MSGTRLAHRLRDRFYDPQDHPYRVFERAVEQLLPCAGGRMLDAGCGRTAPVLRKYSGMGVDLIGIDLVQFEGVPGGILAMKADLAAIPLPDASVDLVISRSVFEHLTRPQQVYSEIRRVLRPGGRAIVLTANMWDYGTLVARCVPNRLHGRVVRFVEGRDTSDTFPTAYRTNTRAAVERLAAASGLELKRFDYLSQYPNYLLFNAALFALGMLYERAIAHVSLLRFLRGWILFELQREP